jgi:importin-7
LAAEVASKSGETSDTDVSNPFEFDGGEDKEIAAMNIAQTIGTVISAVETSPDILAQVQDAITPIVIFTLEKQLIGDSSSLNRKERQ